MAFLGLKLGMDLEMQAAHPHQKIQGVPPRDLSKHSTFVQDKSQESIKLWTPQSKSQTHSELTTLLTWCIRKKHAEAGREIAKAHFLASRILPRNTTQSNFANPKVTVPNICELAPPYKKRTSEPGFANTRTWPRNILYQVLCNSFTVTPCPYGFSLIRDKFF